MPLQTGTGKGPRKHAQTFFHLDPLTHTETATLTQSLDTVLLHRKRLRAGKIFAFLAQILLQTETWMYHLPHAVFDD